jgi:small subunit ribosomal protein S1
MSDQPDDTSFASMFEKEAGAPARQRNLRIGERLDAVVVRIGRDAVFVEIDGKRQAFLEAAELRDADGDIPLREGETLSAHVVEIDESRGVIRLGRTMGKPGNVAALEQAKEGGVAVEGKVTGINKGGLEVAFGATRAFCPMSQIAAHRIEDADAKELVGQTLSFLVTDIKDGGKNVVVSRRGLLQREASEQQSRAMSEIVPGAVMRGTVVSVREFGAFVDLGGAEGLIPRSEIGYDRSVAVADALKPGDVVEVQIREVKDAPPQRPGAQAKKITLSMKALADDPWVGLDLAPGRVVLGTVTRSTDFGRFVRLAAGVEGLLHVSELGKTVKADEGEEIRVVVKSVDRDAKKISLVPAPDDAQVGATVSNVAVKVGAIVTGTVERIETYGLFVQLDGTKGRAGRGLVPNAETGLPRGTDLRKAMPEGTKVTTKVLETGDGRLRLSIKGAKEAEERADFEEARGKQRAPASLGTFADLLKGRKL